MRNNSTLAENILKSLEEAGQIGRRVYQRRLPSDPTKDYYFIHRNTGNTEPIIVEYGFLDNVKDANKLKNNYQDYAEAVVRGVVNYLNKDYIPSIGTNIYTVEKGDSLWNIAKKFNITVEKLKNANNLSNNLLSIGQKLIIPNQQQTTDYLIYTVEKGDTLYSISKKYNLTPQDLINYNKLSTTILTPGQQILIPNNETETEYTTYIVKQGDNLSTLANKFNTTVDQIKILNNLSSNNLSINQKLLIPNKSIEEENYTTYIVKNNDTLWSIANKFNITVENLKDINNLTNNNLSVNQQLKIPVKENTNTYTVVSGDNLYSIARKFNTTVDEIKKKNNLTGNILSIGQILIV